MNKLTKIALGLCAVKVGIETTKYISGKWGNGKMKKNIEIIKKIKCQLCFILMGLF